MLIEKKSLVSKRIAIARINAIRSCRVDPGKEVRLWITADPSEPLRPTSRDAIR